MKKLILLLSCIMLVAVVNAQSPKTSLAINSFKANDSQPMSKVSRNKKDTITKGYVKPSAFYISLGYEVIKKEPASFNTTLIFGNNWGFTYRYTQNDFIPKNLPSDYATVEDIRFVDFDKLKMNSFSISREFQPKIKLIRFGIEAGPSFISYHRVDFTYIPGYEYMEQSFWEYIFGIGPHKEWAPPRYESKYSTHESIGLNLRTKVEFPLTPRLGFEFAAFGNFNKVKSMTGVEFCLTLGLVREKN